MKRIIESKNSISISTNHVEIKLSKKNAKIISVIDKSTGKNINNSEKSEPFVYLTLKGGAKVAPCLVEVKDSLFTFTFPDKTKVDITVIVNEGFFTMEVVNELPSIYTSVDFGVLNLNYSVNPMKIAAVVFAMTINARPMDYPDGKAKATRATAYYEFEAKGAKAAFIIADRELHKSYLRQAAGMVDGTKGLVSYIGGAFTDTHAPNYGDYVIFSDSDPTKVDEWIKFYSKYDIDQMDFHKSGATHREGDFYFHKTDAAGGFGLVVPSYIKRLKIKKKAPWSFYLTPKGSDLFGKEWPKTFEYIKSFKLKAELGLEDTAIDCGANLFEQAAGNDDYRIYAACENEMMKVNCDGSVTRACGYTEAAVHAVGSEVVLFVTKGTGAPNFKALVAEPFKAAGMSSGLHTYAHYINPSANQLLSDPYWLSQLETLEKYTLKNDISAEDTEIATKEDTAGRSVNTNFFRHDSLYIVIEDELIKMTFGDKGFVDCTRGCGGTKAVEHKAGTLIRHIGGVFNLLAPDIDSELLLEVARRTAQAYNEGGFDMIYLDAIDGMNRHCGNDKIWYYDAKFIHEIIKNCNTDPLIEYSAMSPSMWATRGRMGAWDYPCRSYKSWNKAHTRNNKNFMDRYYAATLGWYNFYPNEGGALYDWEKSSGYPGNFWNKYQFFDDIDHMGSLAVAYNMGIVYNPMTQVSVESIPALRRNVENYMRYNTLRKNGYFSEETKEYIRNTMMNSNIEFALVDKKNGSHAFVEKYYYNKKLTFIDSGENTVFASNPFEEQKPFIRIQNHMSSDGSNPITLMTFDETKELSEQTLIKSFDKINLMSNLSFKIKVFGNNSGDAIAMRITSATASEKGHAFFVIPLDFSGWKEFILGEDDNGPTTMKYGFTENNSSYAHYRAHVGYDKITEVEIVKSGNCDGVKVGNLYAVTHCNNPVTNPTVTVGNEAITFNTTLNSAQYIEYTPGNAKAYVYDAIGNATEVDVSGTTPTVPAGDFTATLTGTDSDTMPMRAEVTFGFTGKEIK